MITLKIDNQETEKELLAFVKAQKKSIDEVTIEAIQQFMLSFKGSGITYTKKNVDNHKHVIQKNYDVDNTDNITLDHIHDSAEYIHNLRR